MMMIYLVGWESKTWNNVLAAFFGLEEAKEFRYQFIKSLNLNGSDRDGTYISSVLIRSQLPQTEKEWKDLMTPYQLLHPPHCSSEAVGAAAES